MKLQGRILWDCRRSPLTGSCRRSCLESSRCRGAPGTSPSMHFSSVAMRLTRAAPTTRGWTALSGIASSNSALRSIFVRAVTLTARSETESSDPRRHGSSQFRTAVLDPNDARRLRPLLPEPDGRTRSHCPAGRAMVGDRPNPVDVLRKNERAAAVADAFERAISGTAWYQKWLHGVDPIPVGVLEELAEAACLCRLDDYPDEREAIRHLLLSSDSSERLEPTEQRRRAFGLFLEAVDVAPDAVAPRLSIPRSGPASVRSTFAGCAC